MVYLDNAATTPLSDSVKNTILSNLNNFGNPNSAYSLGQQARKIIEESRKTIAKCLGCNTDEIFFTSGASESNTWALQKPFYCEDWEHSSVKNNPNRVYNKNEAKIICYQLVNNEAGFISHRPKINKGQYIHCDGTQGIGIVPINLHLMDITTFSMSGHKIHAPKGIGLLYIKKEAQNDYLPLIYGGKQEMEKRAGTENVLNIAALATAIEEAIGFICTKRVRFKNLKRYFLEEICKTPINAEVNIFDIHKNVNTHIFTLTFKHLNGEVVAEYLNSKDIYVSTGSACKQGEVENYNASYDYIGIPIEFHTNTIRISMSESTSYDDIDALIKGIVECYERLKF